MLTKFIEMLFMGVLAVSAFFFILYLLDELWKNLKDIVNERNN